MSADLTGDGKTVLKLLLRQVLGLSGDEFHRGLQPESVWMVADLPLDQ